MPLLKEKNIALKNIFTRTCCRSFNPAKKITSGQIKIILKAGQAAPSAKNRQPYFFIVVKNNKCKREIFEAAEKGRKKQFSNLNKEEYKKMSTGKTGSNDQLILEAPVSILLLRDSDSSYSEASNQSLNLLIKEEAGVATAAYSMMLAANALGLGMAWICSPLYIQKELKSILKKYDVDWRKSWQPRVIMPLGYPGNKVSKKPIRVSLKNKLLTIN